VDSESKSDKSLETSCMPRLTLADSLHNLPYSLDERYRALDFKLRNWDLSCPVMGSCASRGFLRWKCQSAPARLISARIAR
jgi:hypothetical protein